MRHKLIIDGNAVYEIDDDCLRCQEERKARLQRLHDREESRKTGGRHRNTSEK